MAEKSEFFVLFDEHWEAGSGRPAQRNVRYEFWVPNEFLNQLEKCGCKISEDTLANWRKGKVLPRKEAFKAILRLFFPMNLAQDQPQVNIDTAREKMRLAYEKSKARRVGVSKNLESERDLQARTAPESLADNAGELNKQGALKVPAGVKLEAEMPVSPETTVVLLTALEVETTAIIGRLSDIRIDKRGATWLREGKFGPFTIVVIEAGAGNPGSAALAAVAVDRYGAGIAAFVGIAGGVKDVKIGDVVVATKVYGYESGKDYPDGFRPRPDVRASDHELVGRARMVRLSSEWRNRLTPALWSGDQPNVFVAPIAAGEVVVGTERGRIAKFLQHYYGDAVAVEMEGRGFLEGVHISSGCRGVVVRGITDLLTGKAEAEAGGSQARAADSAAAFFFAMLALQPDPKQPTGDPKPKKTLTLRDSDRRSDAQKLAKLILIVADIISKSAAAMEALSRQMFHEATPPGADADYKSRSRMLVERLMDAKFEASRHWLSAAHRALEDSLERDAMAVIETVSQHLLPFLFVRNPGFGPNEDAPPSLGAIIPIQVGVESLAVFVLAGIAAHRVEFTKTVQSPAGPRYPVSPHTLEPVPRSGPHNLIIPYLRIHLSTRLGLTNAYRGSPPEEIDNGINDALETDSRERNIIWHYILELPESKAEWPPLRSAWEKVVTVYKDLAVIELDRRLISRDDHVLNSLRRVLGLLDV